MGKVIGVIYTICKAVPIIDGWGRSFLDFYQVKEVEKLFGAVSDLKIQRNVIICKIMAAKNDNEKAVLLGVLNRLQL